MELVTNPCRSDLNSVKFESSSLEVRLTEEPLELFDGQYGVVLRAVMEVVRHLGHVPRHGPAQRDPHRLTGRRPDRRRPQRAGQDQEGHREPRGEHVEVGRFSDAEQSRGHSQRDPKPNSDALFFSFLLLLTAAFRQLHSRLQL